ncbi:type III-B CRISPR module-associated Cmr3 family protein [Desulfovibrio gilichinskyi]|uniref:CRISPR-associated protein, Cmr3 family n=1 Tax=Desulfovibrio gilichinskyi TaxID=1519643 RepID=A0A1X7D7L2_9BACT|nr:type III-B CRISPR module-associated Cmr3 family protein [Desulfovibrio gilichinskyi]SMF09867.1 CRISPR-associated protein, Cmr3 family [Desulfovibrio gilichinskyi]
MFVEIAPLDTIFCRDGRSFGVNEAHAVDSIFPPPPSVMFGAMRGGIFVTQNFAALGRNKMDPGWPKWFGDTESAGDLFQKGPLPVVDGQIMFPMPLDGYVKSGKNGEYTISTFRIIKNNSSTSSLDLEHLLIPPEGKKLPKSTNIMWISASSLTRYLNSEEEISLELNKDIYPQDELWTPELRTNVGINPETNAGKDAILFSLKHVRMNSKRNARLLCKWGSNDSTSLQILKDIITDTQGSLAVAGERRCGSVATSDLRWPDASINTITPDKEGYVSFRIYIATPAYFDGGWRPESDSNKECIIKSSAGNVKATLLTAAVGKPFYLGGYDIHKRQQRPARGFVPAGSVYHFKAKADQLEKIIKLNGQVIGDNDFLRAQGFGLCLLGNPISNSQE